MFQLAKFCRRLETFENVLIIFKIRVYKRFVFIFTFVTVIFHSIIVCLLSFINRFQTRRDGTGLDGTKRQANEILFRSVLSHRFGRCVINWLAITKR